MKNIATPNTLTGGLQDLKVSIEELAQMTANGFADVKTDFNSLKTDFKTMRTDLSDMKLRLDYLAPNFEVRDLEKRVTRLEIKTGLRHVKP